MAFDVPHMWEGRPYLRQSFIVWRAIDYNDFVIDERLLAFQCRKATPQFISMVLARYDYGYCEFEIHLTLVVSFDQDLYEPPVQIGNRRQ